MNLAWDTFILYEAPEYTKEGITSFRNFVRDPILKTLFIEGKYNVLDKWRLIMKRKSAIEKVVICSLVSAITVAMTACGNQNGADDGEKVSEDDSGAYAKEIELTLGRQTLQDAVLDDAGSY